MLLMLILFKKTLYKYKGISVINASNMKLKVIESVWTGIYFCASLDAESILFVKAE